MISHRRSQHFLTQTVQRDQTINNVFALLRHDETAVSVSLEAVLWSSTVRNTSFLP